MAGLGTTEILLILGIVLLFFGPSRLPSLGKSIGQAIGQFKGSLNNQISDSNEAKKESIDG